MILRVVQQTLTIKYIRWIRLALDGMENRVGRGCLWCLVGYKK